MCWYPFVWNNYLSESLVQFGFVLCHIKRRRLLNAKSSLYIYIKYIWLGWVLWHINHCRLFNVKSPLYIYTKYTWFSLVVFYGISTIVDLFNMKGVLRIPQSSKTRATPSDYLVSYPMRDTWTVPKEIYFISIYKTVFEQCLL